MADEYKDGARIYADVAAEAKRIQERRGELIKQSKRQVDEARRDNEMVKRTAGR